MRYISWFRLFVAVAAANIVLMFIYATEPSLWLLWYAALAYMGGICADDAWSRRHDD